MKICHVTSVHISTDTRLMVKECPALADAGYETYLVAKGESREERGVHVVGVGEPPQSRVKRILTFSGKVYKKALELDCEIYHLHDPELLPYGLKLKKKGKKVIFDSHEDIPGQILDKHWIPSVLRKIISGAYRRYESYAVKRMDAVVAATPHIGEIFENRTPKVAVVNNYPCLSDIEFCENSFEDRERIIGYAGELDAIRSKEMIFDIMKDLDGTLILAGQHTVSETDKNICCIGKTNRAGINDLYAKSRLGFVLYVPAANHYDAQPNKMFEYMAAGLPYVASDFPLWKEIVENNNCGICVNPLDKAAVTEALNKLLDDPQMAQQMGRNGRKAIEEKYNWESEKEVLVQLYKEMA